MQTSMIHVIDCTLRDGGYGTNWRFEDHQVRRHIAGTAANIIEIGYRAPVASKHGIYRYCPDAYLDSINIPMRLTVAVMVNASEYMPDLFFAAADSRIDVVRVAAHIEQIGKAACIVDVLNNKGYRTTLNLMQAHRAPDILFESTYDAEVVYFADSFGCMNSRQVSRIVEKLTRHNRHVGFHAHNNTRRALSNTMAAIKSGATWVDATAGGVGRGAGNTDLNALLERLDRKPGSGLIDLTRPRTIWPTIVYYIGAMLRQHPTRAERWA